MTTGPKLLLSAFVAQIESSFLEWLAYHRAIGADHAYIAVDRKKARKMPLLQALEAAGAVTIVPVAVDPDVKEEIHNSALRAAQMEQGETGGYGLYLAPNEYFRIHSRARNVQSLMRSCGGADVLSAPVQTAVLGERLEHVPGPLLQGARPVAPLSGAPALRSVVRLGLFASRNPEIPTGPAKGKTALNWVNGDGEPMPEPHSRVFWASEPSAIGAAKASVLEIPAASVESFLLRQQGMHVKHRLSSEAVLAHLQELATLQELAATEAADPGLAPWAGAIEQEMAALTALPQVAEAQATLCAQEIALLEELREKSDDFRRITAICRGEPVPEPLSPTATPAEPPVQVEKAQEAPVPGTKAKAQEAPAPDPDGESEDSPAADVSLPPWFGEIHTSGENEGFYTRLKNHAVLCVRRDPARLVVTFDNLSNVNDLTAEREPWAYKFVHDNGCSHLSVMARSKDWFRDRQLITYLERLSGDGFFAAFDKVFLTGTSMGGFAALAFASLAPGATVISFNPQTTLDETLVPWEKRFGMGRARDWSLPYSDCAFEIDEVKKAFVIYDPFFEPDRRHIERLEGTNVIALKTWCSGHFSPTFLRRADILKPMMQHALDDTLTPQVFYAMFRKRRNLPWYSKALESNLTERGHMDLAKRVKPAFRKLRRQAAE